MKISVGVKIFGVVVVLLILVGSAAWYQRADGARASNR